MASRKPPEVEAAEPAAEEPTGDSATSRSNGNRFFEWMRGLGIQRQPGWIGGVASGIGFRLGVDPIIVRGIIVVVAVLGGPALLLYAAAWFLLPDTNDTIHAEELFGGRFNPAIIGVGAMALLSLLPLNQGFWYVGAAYWGDLTLGASIGRFLWTAILLAAVIVLIIWVARRASGAPPTTTPATTDDKPDTIPTPVIPADSLADDSAAHEQQLSEAPVPPPAPAPDAPADELQAWKESQALWKQQHAEWKAQRSATERELRHQRAMEAHERALAASTERTEQRRLRRLANPRINAATAWAVLGLAIIAGGIASIVAAGNTEIAGHEATLALSVSAITLGVGGIVAGALRHRSGVLGFFALVAVLAMLVSAVIPRDRQVLVPGSSWGVGQSSRLAVPAGPLYLTANPSSIGGVTDVWQASGYTQLWVAEGASVRLEFASTTGSISIYDKNGNSYSFGEDVEGLHRVGDEWRWSTTLGPDAQPDKIIRLWQGDGDLVVMDDNRDIAADAPPTEEEPTEGKTP